jgi:hypothetical protein
VDRGTDVVGEVEHRGGERGAARRRAWFR